ncbi:MAG: Phosphoesterase [Pseudonocardia sp.]|nr:Phosphoesterase [Pseudonocardia sp.]
MVRVLAVADEVSDALWGPTVPSLATDLVLAAGDLPWDYLEYLTTVLDRPVVFVPGNHDPAVDDARAHRSGQFLRAGLPCEPPRPTGCVNADGAVVDAGGLRIAGLGGCVRYRPGPNQYSQREYARRAARLLRRVTRLQRRDSRPVDVLLTHAPPRGLGDETDRPHVGIDALHTVLDRLQPQWHLHGHIHPHGRRRPDRAVGVTTIRNVIPYRLLEITPAATTPALVGGRRAP